MNKKGLLIYNKIDYEKNKWFAHEIVNKAPLFGLEIMLVLRENLTLTIENGTFLALILPEPSPICMGNASSGSEPSPTCVGSVPSGSEPSPTCVGNASSGSEPSPICVGNASSGSEPSLIEKVSTIKVPNLSHRFQLSPGDVSFVINRSRDTLIATHFEKMGCKVFNNSLVTEICNHKGKTHQLINSHGIPSVKTLIGNAHYFNPSQLPFAYPIILKSVNGHGGSEVYKIHNETELTAQLHALRTEDFVLQELCTNPGIDVRVFTLGKEIVGAVKRVSTKSFKSNYSLGGLATAYTLTSEQERLVKSILSLLDFDFVGIDFIFDREGRFLFNEIEDVVGTRTLYLNYDFDVVGLFLEYISRKLI